MLGSVPRHIFQTESDRIRQLEETNYDLSVMQEKRQASRVKYMRTRPAASAESSRRAKTILTSLESALHPLFREEFLNFEIFVTQFFIFSKLF